MNTIRLFEGLQSVQEGLPYFVRYDTSQKVYTFTYENFLSMTWRGAKEIWGARLPGPPLLALTSARISRVGGRYEKGFAEALYDTEQSRTITNNHFKGDPIVPGVLGIESGNQLTGIFGIVSGCVGQAMFVGLDGFRQRNIVVPSKDGVVAVRVDIVQRRESLIVSEVSLRKMGEDEPYATLKKCLIAFVG